MNKQTKKHKRHVQLGKIDLPINSYIELNISIFWLSKGYEYYF